MSMADMAGDLEPPADLLPITTCAKRLRIHVASLWRWCESGKVASWKCAGGARRLVSLAEVTEFMRPKRVTPKKAPQRVTAREARQIDRETREFLAARGLRVGPN